MSWRLRLALRRRYWRKYWVEQDNRNHVEYFRALAADWRSR